MKQIIFGLITFFLFLFNFADAQTTKVKTKPDKIKIKETSANTPVSNNGLGTTTAISSQTNTNFLRNTSWKNYIAQPLKDTTIWRFENDSSFIESSTGVNLVYGLYTLSHDTLTIQDLGGRFHCNYFQIGKYKINLYEDSLSLALIEDDCEARAGIINAAKLQRVKRYVLPK